MSLLASDPQYAKAAQAIANMPPAQALQYLTDHNLPPALAVGVLEQAQLKKRATQQQKIQQAQSALQGQPQTTLDSTRSEFKQAMDQYNADANNSSGIANLPVPNSMFSNTPGMKGGGLVSFAGDEGSLVQSQEQADMQPNLAESYYANLINQQNAARQQAAMQQAQAAKTPVMAAAKGGKVKKFADGGPSLGDYAGNINPAFSEDYPASDQLSYDPRTGVWTRTPAASQPILKNSIFEQGLFNIDPTTGQTVLPQVLAAKNSAIQAPQPATSVVPQDTSQMGATAPNAGMPPRPQQGAPQGFGYDTSIPKDMQTIMDKEEAERAEQKARLMNPAKHLADFQNNLASFGYKDASADYLKTLDDRKDLIEHYKDTGNSLALANMGFAIAEAATNNPHGGFLGALAAGGKQAGKDFLQAAKEYRDSKEKLADQAYAVQQSKNQYAMTMNKEYYDNVEKDQARYDTLTERHYDTVGKVVGIMEGRKNAAAWVAAARASRPINPTTSLFEIGSQRGVDSPEFKQGLASYKAIQGASAPAQNAQMTQGEKQQALHQQLALANPQYSKLVQQSVTATGPELQALQVQMQKYRDAYSGDIFNTNDWGNPTVKGRP